MVEFPSEEEATDSQKCEIICDNSDGYFTDLDLQGWDAVVQFGLTTSVGAEYSTLPPFKCVSMQLSSIPGVLQCHISLIGIPDRLELDQASDDYEHHWSSAKTVKDLITEIASGQPVTEELTEKQETTDDYVRLGGYDVGTTDLEGAIKTEAAIDATSLALKGLGTGTINAEAKIQISGHYQPYIVQANATITANEATVTISPALVDVAEVDDAVTLSWRFGTGQTANVHVFGQRRTISNRTVNKLSFKLKKTGSPSGNVTFKVYDMTNDVESGSKVLSNASALTTSPVWYEVTFDTPLALDGDYLIYAEFVDGDSSNYVQVQCSLAEAKLDEWAVLYTSTQAPGDPDTEWDSYDCVYRYKYNFAGIEVFDHCEAYTVTYDSEDSLIDSFCPTNGFKISEGQSRLSIINYLLSFTGCVKRCEDDGEIHAFVPTTTGTSYDSQYSLASGHTFFSKAIRKALVIPNKITVHSFPDDDDQYTGSATDATSYALLPIEAFYRAKLTSNAQAASIAAAMIAQLQRDSQRGSVSVPMNLGAEVYDYILATDQREDDTRAGNIGYIKRSWKPSDDAKDWRMDFSLGSIGKKPIIGSKPSALTKRTIRTTEEEPERYVSFSVFNEIYNELVEHILTCWDGSGKDAEGYWGINDLVKAHNEVMVILTRVLAILGKYEGETPTDEQIDTSLLDYYSKSQIDAKAYLQNIVEDTSPQLGGNLDVNGHSIRDTTNGVPISAGNQNVPITAGGTIHDFDTSGNLDMNQTKVVDLLDPTSDQEAATKKYVDDNAGLANVVEDLTPQLGGNLEVNGKSIRDIVNGVPIVAGNLNVSITAGGTLHDFDINGNLDMNQTKVVDLLDPTAAQDAATKGYVDDEIAGASYLENVVEDTTPQLGGNLEVNGHSIRDTTNGVPISAGNLNVPITSGGTIHDFDINGNLDMNQTKVIDLLDPTADQEAATKKYVDDNAEHFNWLAASVQILADTNRTATLSWTDLDVTAQTSATTFAVILQLQINVDEMDQADTDYFELGVRRNGNTPTYYPCLQVRGWMRSAASPRRFYSQVIVGVDSGEIFEYQLTVLNSSATAQADFYINILGYWDTG